MCCPMGKPSTEVGVGSSNLNFATLWLSCVFFTSLNCLKLSGSKHTVKKWILKKNQFFICRSNPETYIRNHPFRIKVVHNFYHIEKIGLINFNTLLPLDFLEEKNTYAVAPTAIAAIATPTIWPSLDCKKSIAVIKNNLNFWQKERKKKLNKYIQQKCNWRKVGL